MGIFKAVGGALNQLSEFLTTAERNKQIKEGVANGELMEVHQASFIIQVLCTRQKTRKLTKDKA